MRADNEFTRSKLDDELVRRILQTAASRGVMSVSLTGGEPLLYERQVFELLAYARNVGIPLTRTGTNGFMFRHHRSPGFEDRVTRLADKISNTGLHTSGSASTPRTRRATRRIGVFRAFSREYGGPCPSCMLAGCFPPSISASTAPWADKP